MRIPAIRLNKAIRYSLAASLLMFSVGSALAASQGMEPLSDEQMANVNGAGIAFALNDIRMTASPTSYIELTGSPVSTTNFRQADLRWYGISVTGADASVGTSWSGFCTSGPLGLGCPLGGTIGEFAPHDNPTVLRVFEHDGVSYTGVQNDLQTYLELVLPTAHEPYRFSFWGEVNLYSGAGASGWGKLQVQNIWNNIDQGGTKFQVFSVTEEYPNPGDFAETVGIIFENHFSGDIRMSVNQGFLSPDTLGFTPEFVETEGFYATDYRVFLPMGRQHYQALVLKSDPTLDGDFIIEQTLVPNTTNVYNDFYGRTYADDPTGGYDDAQHNALGTYYETHGYVRIGDLAPTVDFSHYSQSEDPTAFFGEIAGGCMPDRPTCDNNGAFSTSDGVFFQAAPGTTFSVRQQQPHYVPECDGGCAYTPPSTATTGPITSINLGDSSIEGMLIHQLRIKSLGAGS